MIEYYQKRRVRTWKRSSFAVSFFFSCDQICLFSATPALFVGALSKRAIRECEHRCRQRLTQWIHPTVCLCSTDTVESLDSVGSAVPVKSNNSISDGLLALTRRAGSTGGRRGSQHGRASAAGSAAECKEEEALRAPQHTRTQKCPPHALRTGISFKCQIIHLEQVRQNFRDLLGECQTGPWICTKLWIQRSVHWLSIVKPEGGQRDRSQTTPSRCTYQVHMKSQAMCCLLNNPVMFMLWKHLVAPFPVQLGAMLYVSILQWFPLPFWEKKDILKCHQTRQWYLLAISGFRLTFTSKRQCGQESINWTGRPHKIKLQFTVPRSIEEKKAQDELSHTWGNKQACTCKSAEITCGPITCHDCGWT